MTKMKKYPLTIITLFILSTGFANFALCQTVDELKAENLELKEKLRLIIENNDLRAKIEAARNGAVQPQPKAAETSNQDDKPTNLVSIEGIKNLFVTNKDTVVTSVCAQQALDRDRYNDYERQICALAEHLVSESGDNRLVLEPGGEVRKSVTYFLLGELAKLSPTGPDIDKELRAFILDTENKRNDKQVGGDSKSSGTTSLAVKGGVPQFLSWATEHGAATGSRSGNTVTFRVNPVGLLDSLSSYRPIEGLEVGQVFTPPDAFTQLLKKFSIGLSFDISRGTDPPTLIGSKQQLAAFSVRYNFLNRKDPLHPAYRADWEAFRKGSLIPFAQITRANYDKLVCSDNETGCDSTKFKNADLEKWRSDTEKKLQELNLKGKSNIERVELVRKIIVEQLAAMPLAKLKVDQVIMAAITTEGKGLINYYATKKKLQDRIAKGEVLTLEYTNYREVNAPDFSNIRFIAEKGFGSEWNLTANASLSFLNKMPTGLAATTVKRIRDFDFTLQLEKPLMEMAFGRPVLSFAGQWQRLPANIIGPDGKLKANTKGDAAIGQLKLTIPINGTGIKLPFSVTFANRSELVKESTVRGNFGFTFDLDRLLLGRKLF